MKNYLINKSKIKMKMKKFILEVKQYRQEK